MSGCLLILLLVQYRADKGTSGYPTPRVEKTYSDSAPPHRFMIDEPGLTGIYPVGWAQNELEEV